MIGGAAHDRHRAEAERTRVGAVDVVLAGHQTFHGIVVEREGVAQIHQRPFDDADDRVDLFATIAARISERELAGRLNL